MALVAGEADLVVAARVAAGEICATIAVPHTGMGYIYTSENAPNQWLILNHRSLQAKYSYQQDNFFWKAH